MTRSPVFRGDRRLLSLQALRGLQRNARQKMDGLKMLAALPNGIAALAFCDPQYRTGLDQLKFGNEGERQAGRAQLPQMTDATISKFLRDIHRVLRPSGHLMLWMDKFSIGSGTHLRLLKDIDFGIVDLIAWNKMRPGMGRRTRGVTEYLIVLQKPPQRAKGCWTDHSLRDCWSEYSDRDIHAHCKPFSLTERLIRATTEAGDLVIDPCAGGYGVLEACAVTGREFMGADLL